MPTKENIEKLLLIDGNSLAFRAFYALHNSLDRFISPNGLHTNALYGFKLMLDFILNEIKPTNVLVAFDAGKKTFRTERFADYKGGRAKTPSELSEQFPYFKELLAGYGIKSVELANYEADDIIGTMAKKGEAAGFDVSIISGDRDLIQLASDHISVLITKKGVTDVQTYTPATIKEQYQLTPEQIIDMKALVGDNSDNYPGVTKIGEKTAIKLLTQYHSLQGIYDHLAEMKKSKMKENLQNEKEIAFLCQDLARILTDAPMEVDLADTKWTGLNVEKLTAFYREMNFSRFLDQLAQQAPGEQLSLDVTAEPVPLTVTELTVDNLNELTFPIDQSASFHLEVDGDNYHQADLIGFALQVGEQYYFSRDVELLKTDKLKAWLENQAQVKDVCDLKKTYAALLRLGITLQGVDFDLLLASYLVNNRDNSNDMGVLTKQNNYSELMSDEEFYGRGAKRTIPTDNEKLANHLAHKVKAITDLKAELTQALTDHQQEKLYRDIEKPLAVILAQMESTGVVIDQAELVTLQSEFEARLTALADDIYAQAGEEFNISSPKQLGHILFEKLKLPVIKETKTGYSTAVDVLEKLRPENPIIEDILEYRQIKKLQSTYIEGLLKVIAKDGRIHTRYTQTLTTTGRLSSVEPNLQNIPVRMAEGRQIRKAFVATDQDHVLFACDYSQIELRVLAHVSGDEKMQAAFKNDEDIHDQTARQIFNLSETAEVTSNMRRQAKAVNFGIVYGISDYGLSQSLGISRQQAKQFIEAYLANYPGVKKYMEQMVKTAKVQGYVTTIFNRRRYLPEINSRNFNLRSFAERTAMNTPIQGSAADIIKIAMIKMQAALKENNLKTKMILQVHDELIFDAPKSELPILEKLVPEVMNNAVKLAVPLKVDQANGPSWYEAK